MSCPVVETPNGKVSGKVFQAKCKDAKPVYCYRNIPFGKPPVGNLRFMPPQPAAPWDGIRDGTKLGKIPIQNIEFGDALSKFLPFPRPEGFNKLETSEDCLHLSVYTPEPAKGKNLPVMVWLYGGGFQMGSETIYDGTALAGMNNVILVVPNYRVNIFGFLTLGKSSQCTGNAGILDQQLALKWVQENIEAFGGDKTNVTIFGESAGAMSVHFQILSPLSRGLYHKAISHSGQANMPNLFISEERNGQVLAFMLKELGIEEKDDTKLLDILQKMPTENFEKVLGKMLATQMGFGATLDGKAFVKTPEQSLKDKDFPKIPYMMGYNNSEGHGLLSQILIPDFVKGISGEEAKAKSAIYQLSEEGYEAIKKAYLKDEHGDTKFSRMFGGFAGDLMFVVPAEMAAQVHTGAGADVYKYVGEFQLRFHHDEAYGKEVAKKAEWCICDHGDDVIMTFGVGFLPNEMPLEAKLTDDEISLSRKWMTYLTNFAKTGNPNKGDKVDVVWAKHTAEGEYLAVNHELKIGKDARKDTVGLWSKIAEIEKNAKKA